MNMPVRNYNGLMVIEVSKVPFDMKQSKVVFKEIGPHAGRRNADCQSFCPSWLGGVGLTISLAAGRGRYPD